MDRWTNMLMSTHMKYLQVSTSNMFRKATRHVIFKKVGYEECKIYGNGHMIN